LVEEGGYMAHGQVIFLNGVTSAGKTIIAKELQAQSDLPFLHMSNDMFQQMVGGKWLRADYCDALARVIAAMYHCANALSGQGQPVIIDGMLLELQNFIDLFRKTHLQFALDTLASAPLLLVEVYCPLKECARRSRARKDREKGQPEAQNRIMAQGVPYDLRVNTLANDAGICAKNILEKLAQGGKYF
jgi:chloramphenicol 3-O-phosphotransferase